MKLSKTTALLVLIYCTLSVLAKGGGGGGGKGGGGGGTSSSAGKGGSSSSSSSSSSKGGSSSSSSSSGKSGTSASNSVSSKGGAGSFGSTVPPSYSNSRTTYTHYAPTYSGRYSSGNRYGYVGYYNPALFYFAIFPPFLYYGHYSYYHRYDINNGYYYAPEITYSGNNSPNVVINGTANSGNDDNYHYTFNISTNNQYLFADHAFYGTSDPSAYIADFAYRIQFSYLIEFDDTNQNGFYDGNEPVYSITSLQNLNWSPFQVTNQTASYNSSLSYLQAVTSASNVIYNNTASTNNSAFGIQVNFRASNVQINNTAAVTIQPNSLQYDIHLTGFPSTIKSTKPASRLGLIQLVSTEPDEPIIFDVNMTTPIDQANIIRTNETYGMSVGNYTQGRIEYQSKVNISDITSSGINIANWTSINVNQMSIQYGDWIWGTNPNKNSKLLVVTIPDTTNNTVTGFGFLDVDVMNALASGASSITINSNSLMVILSIVLYFIIY